MAPKQKQTRNDARQALNAARRKKQEQYWLDRAQSRVIANDRSADVVKAEQARAYKTARERVASEITKFYANFSDAAGISDAQARQRLSQKELQDFQKELERKRAVIQKMIADDPENKALRRYDQEWENLSKVRELTRKEALEANIEAEIAQLGGKQQISMDTHLKKVIGNSLKMNAEDIQKLGDVDAKLGVGSPEQVMRAAKENWQHSDFSARIWSDKEKLIKETREIIEDGFARHKGAIDMATDLMTRMNVSHSNALRVVRTEFNHLSNTAALEEYKAKGIKQYKFVAAIDNRTCDVCHELDGKVFNVAEARTGVNFPPIHPNCRSVTVPVMDWSDDDQWDYSGIELDDDELKALGMTREDAKALDDTAPALPDHAPKPELSVRDADRAANDTQSVIRRAELAEAIKQQGEAIEIKARHVNDDVGNIIDEIDLHEKWNDKLYKDLPITLPQAAIEVENLDNVRTKILKAELEAEQLQVRAAKLDESVPKPDPKRAAALEDEIAQRTDARKHRQEADLPNGEIVRQATPKPFDQQKPDIETAIEPRSAFGKWWQKVRDKVDRAKERFDAWLHDFGESTRKLRNAMNVSMVMPGFPYGTEPGGDMPRTEALKLVDEITKRRKNARGGQLFTDEERALVERWHKSHPERNPESIIAVRMVGKRPVVVDRAGFTHMLEEHHDFLIRTFDNEDSIIDGLYHLLNHGQNMGPQKEKRNKGDSSPRIIYKGEWHGKTIAVSINVHEDRIFGANRPDRL